MREFLFPSRNANVEFDGCPFCKYRYRLIQRTVCDWKRSTTVTWMESEYFCRWSERKKNCARNSLCRRIRWLPNYYLLSTFVSANKNGFTYNFVPEKCRYCGCEWDNDGKNANEGLNGTKKNASYRWDDRKRNEFFFVRWRKVMKIAIQFYIYLHFNVF